MKNRKTLELRFCDLHEVRRITIVDYITIILAIGLILVVNASIWNNY